jgi:hypothetical protein
MSPNRPDELVNQPQYGRADDQERTDQHERPQGLGMGNFEPCQGEPCEQEGTSMKESVRRIGKT